MSPGVSELMKVINKPKSKWPYWVLFTFKNPLWPHAEDLSHVYKKMDLVRDKIQFKMERQWAVNTGLGGKKYKTQYGILYKFLNEEDRLIFLMEREVQ